MYVAYCFTQYQDCHEEHAMVYAKKEDALAWLTRCLGDESAMVTCKLFHLGEEIPIVKAETEIPQPSVKTKRFVTVE